MMSKLVSSFTFDAFGNENLFKMWNVIPIGICVLTSISLSHGFFPIYIYIYIYRYLNMEHLCGSI